MVFENIANNTEQYFFGNHIAPKRPPVLKPLRFCEFRTKDQSTQAVDGCATLACGLIEEMALCLEHGPIIRAGLEREMTT